jgi:hypothetical protein
MQIHIHSCLGMYSLWSLTYQVAPEVVAHARRTHNPAAPAVGNHEYHVALIQNQVALRHSIFVRGHLTSEAQTK